MISSCLVNCYWQHYTVDTASLHL